MAEKKVNYEVTATDGFTPTFQKLKGQITYVKDGVGELQEKILKFGIGALTVEYFAELGKRMLEFADQTGKAAQKAGMATEEFSKMAYAAAANDVSMEGLTKGMKGLSDMMVKAHDKTSMQATLMKQMGVDLNGGLNPALLKIADTFKSLPDGPTKIALAVATLGKEGQAMIPMLNLGSEAIKQLQEEATKFGLVVGEDAARASDHLNSNLKLLGMTSNALGIKFANEFAGSLAQVTDRMKEAYLEGGKLYSLWIGFGGISTLLFTDDMLTPLQKVTKQIKSMEKDVNDVIAAKKESPGLIELIVGNQDDALSTRLNALTMQLADLRVQRAAMLEDERKAAAERATQDEAERKRGEEKAKQLAKTLAEGAAQQALAKQAAEELQHLKEKGEELRTQLLYGRQLTDTEKKLADIAAGKYDKYGPKLKEQLRTQAEQNQSDAEKIRLQSVANAMLDQYVKGLEAENAIKQKGKDIGDDMASQFRDELRDEEFQLSLIGKSQAEVARLTALRRIDLAMQKAAGSLPGSDSNEDTAANSEALVRIAGIGAAQKASLSSISAQNSLLQDQQNIWQNLASDAGKYFGTVGEGFGKLVATMVDMGKRQEDLAAKRLAIEDDPKIDPVKRAALIDQVDRKSTQARLAGYGDMADAASQFFDKQSRGYKALQTVSQVFHAAELAMTLAELVPKGIAAVLNQGNGDPYSAFARVAAMAAIVAGLGVAIGGGSGGGASATSYKDTQAAQGAGSVLGDSTAKSESISKSLDLLSKSSVLGNDYMSSMLRTLRSIDTNINGLASILARTVGASLTGLNNGYDSLGINLGTSGNALHKTSTDVTDSGILASPGQTVGGVAYGGFYGQSYADVTQSSSSLFGLIKSSSSFTDLKQLPDEITSQFAKIIVGLRNNVLQAIKIFGMTGDSWLNTLNAISVDFGKISFKGLTGDEIEKQLESIFSKLGDDMVRTVLPGIEKFQKVGEGLFETVARLAQEFTATDAVARILGKDVSKAFGDVGFASMGARDALVQLFGGIDELSDSVGKYYDAFYTEGEKNAAAMATITDQFAVFGVKVPTTMEAYRKLVEAQDLSTEAGRNFFEELIKLAPAFAKVQDAIKQTTSDIFDAADKVSGGKLGKTLKEAEQNSAASDWNAVWKKISGQDGSVAATIDNVRKYSGNLPVLQSMIDAAMKGGGQPAVDALKRLFQAVADNTDAVTDNTTVQKTQSLEEMLAGPRGQLASYLKGSLTSDLSPLDPKARLDAAQTTYIENLLKAQNNDVDAVSAFSGLRDSYLREAKSYYASDSRFTDIFNSTYNQGAMLTGGLVKPFTAADGDRNTETLQGELKTLQVQVTQLISTVQASAKAQVDATNSSAESIATTVSGAREVTKFRA